MISLGSGSRVAGGGGGGGGTRGLEDPAGVRGGGGVGAGGGGGGVGQKGPGVPGGGGGVCILRAVENQGGWKALALPWGPPLGAGVDKGSSASSGHRGHKKGPAGLPGDGTFKPGRGS